MPTLDTIGISADGIGLFRGFSPSNFTGETKDPNGVFTEAGWIRTPKNSLEIYSALFEMGFFKKGAIFISSKSQSAKGVNFSGNRLKGWRLFSYYEKGR